MAAVAGKVYGSGDRSEWMQLSEPRIRVDYGSIVDILLRL
jgi:hypothetical protein